MICLSSTERTVEELVEDGFTYITWDLESIDDFPNELDSEPVVSYALTFAKTLEEVPERLPTRVCTATSVSEERDLLVRLKQELEPHQQEVTLVGHNAAFWLPYFKERGFDAGKVVQRGETLGVDPTYIRGFDIYDTMDVAGEQYRHTDHHKTHEYLRLDELKQWYNIRQPTKFEGLGSDVRQLFRRGEYERILLYNVADSMTETVVAAVLHHQQTVCRAEDGRISHTDTCPHRLEQYDLKQVEDWKRITARTRFAESPV